MADIFISYARKDRSRVEPLADALSRHGWSVWWDPQIRAGRTFDQTIAAALAAARCVLVVWSKESISSDWVRDEADEGRRRDILIPVTIDDVRPPLGFGRIQAARLGDWSGDTAAQSFRTLITDITSLLGAPPARPARDEPSPAETPPSAVPDREPALTPERHPSHQPPHRPFARRMMRLLVALAGAAAAVLLVATAFRLAGGVDSQPRPTTGPSAEPALVLNAVMKEGGEPLEKDVDYDVYGVERDPQGNRKRIAGSPSYNGPPKLSLAPGRYFVTASFGNARASTELAVPDRTVVLQTLILRAGRLVLSSRLSPASPPIASGVEYVVLEAAKDIEGNRKRVASSPWYDGPPRVRLAAGRYYVTARYASASTGTEIDIAEGEVKPLSLDLHAGVLRLSTVLNDGGTPLPKGVNYAVFDAAKDAEGNSKRITSSPSYDGPPRFPLTAGRYTITATYGSASASQDVDVAAGEVKPHVLNLNAGILAVTAIDARGQALLKGVNYVVYEAAEDVEGNRKRVTSSPSYEPPPRFPLSAGRYYVEASGDAGKANAAVDLREGAMTPLELRLAPTAAVRP